MRAFAILDFEDNESFVVKVNDRDYEKAKQLSIDGIDSWHKKTDGKSFNPEMVKDFIKSFGIRPSIDKYCDTDSAHDDIFTPKPGYEDLEVVVFA